QKTAYDIFTCWSSDVCSSDLPEELEQMGLGGCSNINWGNGHLAIRRKMEPYIQAYLSTENHLQIITNYGLGNKSYEYSRIITERSEERRVGKEYGSGWLR